LRSRIKADAQLHKDFDFFVRETGWSPEDFLWRLFWDSDLMHINDPMRSRKIKAETWPVPRKTIETVLKKLPKLEEGIEQINATDFSPARSEILCDRKGQRLPRQVEQAILHYFRILPETLHSYGEELSRRLRLADEDWPKREKSWRSIVDLTRRDSLYEKIRAKTEKYHTTRLLRLVNAARTTRGRPTIEQHAFDKWLNELKKSRERSKRQPAREAKPVNSRCS
jgi:hypothetical protein